jgi:hypothetical protein
MFKTAWKLGQNVQDRWEGWTSKSVRRHYCSSARRAQTWKIWKFQKTSWSKMLTGFEYRSLYMCGCVHDSKFLHRWSVKHNKITVISEQRKRLCTLEKIETTQQKKLENAREELRDNGREHAWTHICEFLYTCIRACSLSLSLTPRPYPCPQNHRSSTAGSLDLLHTEFVCQKPRSLPTLITAAATGLVPKEARIWSLHGPRPQWELLQQ